MNITLVAVGATASTTLAIAALVLAGLLMYAVVISDQATKRLTKVITAWRGGRDDHSS